MSLEILLRRVMYRGRKDPTILSICCQAVVDSRVVVCVQCHPKQGLPT